MMKSQATTTNPRPAQSIRELLETFVLVRNRRKGQGGIPMLVLSRKPGEVIVVPQCALTVTVIAVEGNKVRLGIAAPDDIDVFREEVWQRICEQADRPPATNTGAQG